MNINSFKKKNNNNNNKYTIFFFHSFLNHQDPISRLLQHWNQTWGQLHLNVINYYYYYTIAYPITITIILHIGITLLYYYYYYNAINYYCFVIFQLIFENINVSLKYNYCIW